MSFDSLGLHPSLLAAITASGYTEPTPVQAQAIPAALTGVDLMVSACTGSGKTAAFMLPALHRLLSEPAVKSIGPRILVLTPTRELALQVTKAAETYGRGTRRLNVVSVVGGMPYPAQIRLLKQPVDVLVATPGRLLDYIERGRLDFSRLEMLVLDEADRMLDMGFIDDIEKIAAALPDSRQTVMFSATFGGQVGRLAEGMLNSPKRIELATHQDTHASIEQRLHFADDDRHKGKLLEHLLRGENVDQVIIFASTKRDTEYLADILSTQGFAAAALHGDMPQIKRTRTLTSLRRGDLRVLVATDVAARGIDVPTISHVINYGMPMRAEDYVHRIGRTGRAGKNGIAITLAGPAERGKVRAIERFTTQTIAIHVIEGLEPKFNPSSRERRPDSDRRGFSGKPRSFTPGANRSDAPRRSSSGGFGDRSNAGNSIAPRSFGDNRGNSGSGYPARTDAPRRDDNWGNRAPAPATDSRPPRRTEGRPHTPGTGTPRTFRSGSGSGFGAPRRDRADRD